MRREEPRVTLRVAEVDGWLRSHEESVGLDHHFTVFVAEMKQHVKHVLERLDILASAQLQNANIPERAKHVMEGHRKQYIKRVTDFVHGLDIPKEYSELSAFAESFSEQVERLSGDTQKNLFVLKEFLEKEAGAVAKVIGQMDKSITSLRSTFNRMGKEKVDEAYRKLKAYESTVEKRAQLEKALKDERAKLREPKEMLGRIEKRIADLRASSGYRFVQEAHKELEVLRERHSQAVQMLKTAVSPLSRPLKKYAKQCMDKEIVEAYAKDWVAALREDEGLAIQASLSKMGRVLDKLDLKEAQADKVRKTLERATKEWLRGRRDELLVIEKEERDLQDRLKRDTTMMLIKEQERWKESTEEHLRELEKNVGMIEDELERLSPRLALQKLRDSLRELYKNLDLEGLS